MKFFFAQEGSEEKSTSLSAHYPLLEMGLVGSVVFWLLAGAARCIHHTGIVIQSDTITYRTHDLYPLCVGWSGQPLSYTLTRMSNGESPNIKRIYQPCLLEDHSLFGGISVLQWFWMERVAKGTTIGNSHLTTVSWIIVVNFISRYNFVLPWHMPTGDDETLNRHSPTVRQRYPEPSSSPHTLNIANTQKHNYQNRWQCYDFANLRTHPRGLEANISQWYNVTHGSIVCFNKFVNKTVVKSNILVIDAVIVIVIIAIIALIARHYYISMFVCHRFLLYTVG